MALVWPRLLFKTAPEGKSKERWAHFHAVDGLRLAGVLVCVFVCDMWFKDHGYSSESRHTSSMHRPTNRMQLKPWYSILEAEFQ